MCRVIAVNVRIGYSPFLDAIRIGYSPSKLCRCHCNHFGRAVPDSKAHSDGNLKPFNIVAKEAIGVVLLRIQGNAIAQP